MARTSRPAPEPPTPWRIGRYEVLRELSRGGMAVLYLARELGPEGVEKLVVLKRILPELAAHREMLAMFLDEARISALLQHPNLPHGYGLVHQDGDYFFAMEYLHGTDVRQLAKVTSPYGGIPLEHAISIAIGLCAGLHYAHERRANDGTPMHLVHRDVSPRNVFVTYDGTVKLLDFGIARAEQNRSQTATGTLKGTIQYMSPEQVHAGRVDRRSDIFAASIMLWELTVGRALFAGDSDYAVLTAIAERDAPAPSSVRADYPAALETIVMKGLRRNPDERFQTAEELQLALEELARAHRLATSSIGLARFMRETFRDEVDAYHDARAHGTLAHGTLTAHALAEVSTWTRDREPELDLPRDLPILTPPPRSESRPRRTRLLGSGGNPTRSGRRAWLAIAAVVAALGSAIAYWQLSRVTTGDPAAAPTTAVEAPPAPPPAAAQLPARTPAATDGPAPPSPSSGMATEQPTRPSSTKKASRKARKPADEPRAPGTKTLTKEDLDAAFPPKK
jgi:serine/threonine protein kinase